MTMGIFERAALPLLSPVAVALFWLNGVGNPKAEVFSMRHARVMISGNIAIARKFLLSCLDEDVIVLWRAVDFLTIRSSMLPHVTIAAC